MKHINLKSIGLVLRNGMDFEALVSAIKKGERVSDLEDLSLNTFNAKKELGDRRLLRAISDKDVLGLLAFNRCKPIEGCTAEEIGMYVGAQVPIADDNQGYSRAIEEASDNEEAFGSSINLAHPMTLLTSLANNVLCYAAIKGDVRGVNSNYTNGDNSSIISMIQALIAMRSDRAKACYVGGYSALCGVVSENGMQKELGYLSNDKISCQPFSKESKGMVRADGGVYCSIQNENSPGEIEILDGEFCNDGSGPYDQNVNSDIVTEILDALLERNKITLDQIGSLFVSGHGTHKTDQLELKTADYIKATQENLRVYSAGPYTGNLAEAGGILELALSRVMKQDALLRAALELQGNEAPPTAPYELHLRTGIWGDHALLLVKRN